MFDKRSIWGWVLLVAMAGAVVYGQVSLPDPQLRTQPGTRWFDCTASDSTTYSPPLRAFRVYTTAGDVYVKNALDGSTVKIGNVQVGERIDGYFSQIRSTSTTAAGISATE